jgi:hypothetical protein
VWRLPPGHRHSAFVICAVPAVAFGALSLFRWEYYGTIVPNTYYLKMTGVPLADRLGRGLATAPLGLRFAVGPLVIAAAGRRLWRQPQALLIFGVPLSLVAYSVYVGGDIWEWMPITNRYLTPGLPLLIAAGAASISAESARHGQSRRAALTIAAAAILLAVGPSYYGILDWARTKGSHVHDDAVMTEVAIRVRDATSDKTRVAVVWAGTLPYFSRRPAIDLLGKSDAVIAKRQPVLPFVPGHDRFDYDYSIGVLHPDLVVGLWSPTPRVMQLLSELGYEPVFGKVYARRGADVDVGRLREWGSVIAESMQRQP